MTCNSNVKKKKKRDKKRLFQRLFQYHDNVSSKTDRKAIPRSINRKFLEFEENFNTMEELRSTL